MMTLDITTDALHHFLDRYSSDRYKMAALVLLTVAAFALTILNLINGNEIVFTHFFYVPIVISAYWYRYYGVGYTILLGTSYFILVDALASGTVLSLIQAFLRIIVFISISIVIAVLSDLIVRQKSVILEKNTELEKANRELEEKRCQLQQNIVQLAESERNLFASREQLRLILESSGEGIFGIDKDGMITFINPAGASTLGYAKPLDLIGRHSSDIISPVNVDGTPRDRREACFLPSLSDGTIRCCEHDEFRRLDTTIFPVAYCSAPILREGEVDGAVISFEDITDRMRMMKKLEHSLKQKDALLREIHHRVKNNLQIVVSLLNMQSRYVTDKNLLEVIQESQARVRMMAMVHERLYKSEDLSHIDFEDYISFLTQNLFQFYSLPRSQVTYKIDIKNVRPTVNIAIPLGLICNEIISNSLKYAFPNGRKGEIHIEAKTLPDHRVSLVIRDNGVGMPEGFDWKTANSLGVKLVNIFSEQLKARVSMRQDNGTVWEIIIPPIP